jgi:phage terminase large subunit-like protein
VTKRRSKKPLHPVHQYAEDVVSGREVAGPWVRLACKRHLNDLERGSTRKLHFDEAEADRWLQFFEITMPFELEPFQRFIVGALMGWRKTETGTLRFKVGYLEMGKGSGKSPLAGGLANGFLTINEDEAPEVYCAAATRDQANISFLYAKRMAEDSDHLREILQINAHNVYCPDSRGVLRPVSSEGRGLDGKRVSLAIIDELHEHPTPVVANKMRAGIKNRLNGLVLEVTNSGYDRNSVCYAHHQYSIDILEGKAEDDEWFAYVCAMDDEDVLDETGQFSLSKLAANPACWVKANPGLGKILPRSYLEGRVREALGMPSRQSEVLRFNFCVWTSSSKVWIPDEIWMACAAKPERDLAVELLNQPCFGGLDLARSRDLSALALAFPPNGDREEWAYLEYYWIDAGTAHDRSERDRAPYEQWIRQGFLRTTEGNVTDFDFIKADILDILQEYQVQAIAYDRTFAPQLVTELMGEGVQMVPWAQTPWNMETAVSEVERQAFGGLMVHTGHPITRWCMGNVALRGDPNGNRAIDKQRSRERVDGATAIVNGVGWGIRAEPSQDYYQGSGVLSL